MKRSPRRPNSACNAILGLASGIHMVSGLAVIVFQIMLIQAMSPYHDIGGGLWAGPVFFVQGVLGFICLCDILMCSVVSFLVASVIGSLMTVALIAIAALDLGSIMKCPKEDHRSALYFPAYCNPYAAPRISQAAWGIVISSLLQLVASACSVYICMRIIYKSDAAPDPAMSMPYLYDEIPSPMNQARFRGSLQSAQEKVQTFRNASGKSSYSLNSTLPVRRSKSVDRFSEDTDSFSENAMMTSTHSVNIVPSGVMRYGANNGTNKSNSKPPKPTRVPHANSVYSVLYPPDRSSRPVPVHPSSRSMMNLNGELLSGYMKHTAV